MANVYMQNMAHMCLDMLRRPLLFMGFAWSSIQTKYTFVL